MPARSLYFTHMKELFLLAQIGLARTDHQHHHRVHRRLGSLAMCNVFHWQRGRYYDTGSCHCRHQFSLQLSLKWTACLHPLFELGTEITVMRYEREALHSARSQEYNTVDNSKSSIGLWLDRILSYVERKDDKNINVVLIIIITILAVSASKACI